ncbi:T9SS type A sorting domain-containing protein [Flammeovirga sp. SubArs3]|uniref:T9SS type A sorting domain-containing protein n=1 Tax=Flammeovirga sp. SubArs3 TaxID=2995316 RepID=UPI00248BBE68|nr:T9SS type A sorting domain-containing protein [Flammeovirga sp. SubArs3]
MKKILFLLFLIFITKLTISAQTYSVSSSASGFIYIGTRGSLSDFVDEDGNSLPSWTGGYNVRIQSGKNVYIGNNSFDPDVVIDTLFVDGTLNNTAYRTTCHFGTVIVSGSGNFNADNHSGGRLYVNVQDIVLEEGAEFAVPSVGSNGYSGLNWSGAITVEDNVTLSTGGASNNLITLAQINALPGNNPKTVAQGTVDAIPNNINSIVLNGNTALTANLANTGVSIYTQGNDLIIADSITTDVKIYADLASETSPTVDLAFAGNAAGTFSLQASNNVVRSLTMNTTGGSVTLGEPINIVNSTYNSSALILTNGILNTTTTNILSLNEFSFVNNAVYTWTGHASGGSDASHINGPIQKTINFTSALKSHFSIVGANFFLMMPVGKGGTLREAGVGQPTANSSTVFRVEYHNNPHTFFRTVDPMAGVDAVSSTEYWDVDRISGSASAAVTLSYDANSGIQNTHISDVKVMHYDGSHWESQGAQVYNTVGSNVGVLASSPASSFSPFTLGGSNNHDLPVELTYFEGEQNEDGSVSLYWETATEINNSHFEIEASSNGRDYQVIGTVEGNGNSNVSIEYDFEVVAQEAAQYNIFRLRQIDFDGAFEYSDVVVIENTAQSFDLDINVFPVPAHGHITARINHEEVLENSVAVIYNVNGFTSMLLEADHLDNIDISSLTDGIYFLSITTANGLKKVERFIVRN